MNPYDNDKAFVFLEKLKEDSYEYRGLKTDSLGVEEKRAAIRSLMNIRMPGKETTALLRAQDAYLKEELDKKALLRFPKFQPLMKRMEAAFLLPGNCRSGRGILPG